jgi:hypothetical protein
MKQGIENAVGDIVFPLFLRLLWVTEAASTLPASQLQPACIAEKRQSATARRLNVGNGLIDPAAANTLKSKLLSEIHGLGRPLAIVDESQDFRS